MSPQVASSICVGAIEVVGTWMFLNAYLEIKILPEVAAAITSVVWEIGSGNGVLFVKGASSGFAANYLAFLEMPFCSIAFKKEYIP